MGVARADQKIKEYFLHEYLLALWGVPIGEMFDLERLSQECRAANRWKFFFTSAPANVYRKSIVLLPRSSTLGWCLPWGVACAVLREIKLVEMVAHEML